ncbi:AP-4 complex subunit mu-like [Durio zibethinus]|uniref:AP-4 complex subunit mu-like n=1 Tax=Durio zibethinus TaxID=66656 RepID=A0A6P6B6D2_DURZI|nr:AP-4 complex subunit mu-like [Durio zibethinus]
MTFKRLFNVFPLFRCVFHSAIIFQAEVILKVSAEFPANITANTIVLVLSFNLKLSKEQILKKQTRNLKEDGGSEHTLCAKLTFSQASHANIIKEAGTVSMTFTIPMYNASRLQDNSLCVQPLSLSGTKVQARSLISTLRSGTTTLLNNHITYQPTLKQLDSTEDKGSSLSNIAKKSSSYNPYRRVRYVTQANSYVARI